MEHIQGFIRLSEQDTVAVALKNLSAGETYEVDGRTLTLRDDIPFGHKAALFDINIKEHVIKYGHSIGHAKNAISKGSHVHTHNLSTNLDGILTYDYCPSAPQVFQKNAPAFFEGYLRKNGSAGVRNEVWIIPTVGCVNHTAQLLAERASAAFGNKVDGIFAYTHNMGCSQLGTDHVRTQHLLKGLINHPNAGAVLVLSLGCENNNLDNFMPVLGGMDKDRVKFLVTQDAEDELDAGMELLKELTDYASAFSREPISAEKLTLGFKCGGSDAFSGITANALCGRINDMVVSHGGTTILTEVPEMFGAETLLMNRCTSRKVFDDTVSLINHYKEYFTRYHQTIYENPSPGNKKGGISTLEEKSLGCTQKGGQAPVTGVLDYGEYAAAKGLHLLTGSGNDQVSCTNLTASGAQMVLFTTGRGNPFGAPVPTVKISSNTPLYQKKEHWIDYNAGVLLEGKEFLEVSKDFFEYLLKAASGKIKTKNELNGYREISLFRDGVIL